MKGRGGPRIARALAEWAVGKAAAEWIVGDLEETYQDDWVPAVGRWRAGIRYWREALLLVLRYGPGIARTSGHGVHNRTRRGDGMMGSVFRDALYAVRSYWRAPAFAIVALLTLGFGVGANTAVFSVVKGIMFTPLPFPDSEELVSLWTYDPAIGTDYNNSGPNVVDWNEQADWFEGVYSWGRSSAAFAQPDGRVDLIPIIRASSNALEVLGIEPLLGRAPLPTEQGEGAPRVVVLSHGFWETRFGADPGVLGRSIDLRGEPHEVIGVMPPGTLFPRAENSLALIPWELDVTSRGRDMLWLGAGARMVDGLSVEEAQERMNALHQAISEEFPEETVNTAIRVRGTRADIVGSTGNALWMLLGATSFLLVMACANLANLFLAKAVSREAELAVRRSLGASRGRLVRQVLTESVVLGVGAALVGVGVAYLGTDALLALAPDDLPRAEAVSVDPVVLGFALLTALGTALLFGLFPALQVGGSAAGTMREAGRGSVGRPSSKRMRNGLVVVQVSVATVLMVGAGLLARSFSELTAADLGFEVEGVIAADVRFANLALDNEGRSRLHQDLEAAALALPGVTAAGSTLIRPLDQSRINFELRVEGAPRPDPGQHPSGDLSIATGGYFEAMSIPLLTGRVFDQRDGPDSERVVVISESLANLLFGDDDPIGRRIDFLTDSWEAEPQWRTVVGVVGDVRLELAQQPYPTVYANSIQQPQTRAHVVVKTSGDPADLAGPLRAGLAATIPGLPTPQTQTMAVAKATSVSAQKFYASTLLVFAGLALMLATVGIYGILSIAVAQRTAEIGVRVSFGADRGGIVALILKDGLKVAGLGVGVGLLLALALSRTMANLVYEITPTDPVTFIGIGVILTSVAAAACAIPAFRAAGLDPSEALRTD